MSVFGHHRCDEPVAPPVGGLDELRRVRVVAERAPHVANGALQHRLADEDVRPDGVEQFLFGDEAAGARGEVFEQRERLWRERDGRGAAQELSPFGIESEFRECQNLRPGHDGDETSSSFNYHPRDTDFTDSFLTLS